MNKGSDVTATAEQDLADRLCGLIAAHEGLDVMLARHQEALVRGEYDGSLRLFAEFGARLREHMDEETARVLPVYQRLGRWEPNGRPELFRAEHHQLGVLLEKIGALLDEIGGADGLSPAVIIRMIEEEKTLKGVLEHHHCREQRYLYPGVQRRLAAEAEDAAGLTPASEKTQ